MTATVVRPLLKGWSHVVAAVAAVALLPILVAIASPQSRMPAAIFGVGVVALFATSGTFHRFDWQGRAFSVMQHLDHSMIFVVIAATYTPIAMVLPEPERTLVLALVWSGAGVGVLIDLFWTNAPRAVVVTPYLVVGWMAVIVVVDIWRALGAQGFALMLAGGVLHSAGAVIYARKRPDPWPTIFGYHELFHMFVVLGVACHYFLVAFYTLR